MEYMAFSSLFCSQMAQLAISFLQNTESGEFNGKRHLRL